MREGAGRATTYKAVLLEDFFAFCRELNGQYRNFPTVITPAYFDTRSSSKNLVPEADTNDSNTILLQ